MSKKIYKVYGISTWIGDIERKIKPIRIYIGSTDDETDAGVMAALFIHNVGGIYSKDRNWLNTTEIVEENI